MRCRPAAIEGQNGRTVCRDEGHGNGVHIRLPFADREAVSVFGVGLESIIYPSLDCRPCLTLVVADVLDNFRSALFGYPRQKGAAHGRGRQFDMGSHVDRERDRVRAAATST